MSAFVELVAAASDLGLASRAAARGDEIALPGHVCLILSGTVALLTPEKSLLATVAGPGDIVGAETLAGQAAPFTGVWLTPGRVLEAPASLLLDERDPGEILSWLGEASGLGQGALGRELECRTGHAVPARLAKLFSLMRRHGGSDTLEITQSRLAGLLGVQRTSICAAMMDFRRRGLARAIRGKIRISDAAALEASVCGCGPHEAWENRERALSTGEPWSNITTLQAPTPDGDAGISVHL